MGSIDIERYMEETLVLCLRTMFVSDDVFTVDPIDNSKSKVRISSAKPEKYDTTIPHIYISGLSYSPSDIGLNRGFKDDIIKQDGREAVKRAMTIDANVSFVVAGPNDSKVRDLANALIFWLYIAGRDFIAEQRNIEVKAISKSPGGKVTLAEPVDLFTQNVSVQLSAGISIEIARSESAPAEAILNQIKLNHVID